jgi:hypothetical protein
MRTIEEIFVCENGQFLPNLPCLFQCLESQFEPLPSPPPNQLTLCPRMQQSIEIVSLLSQAQKVIGLRQSHVDVHLDVQFMLFTHFQNRKFFG